MLRLGTAPHGWIDLIPGSRARFDPIVRPMVRAARRAAAQFITDNPDMDEEELRGGAGDAFTAELIRRGLREWEGVGDADGNPIPVTPETIDLFLADPLLFDEVDAKYVVPWASRAAEKNGSSPSPAGTSTAATGAKITAGSRARRAKNASPKATAVKNAPTANTRPRTTRGKPSGK